VTTSSARDDEDLSLQAAADLLGVHYMTAYRYVRTGRLPATQVDGTWRVRRSNLTALAPPGRPGRAKRGSSQSNYERGLTDQLVHGDEAEAWRLTQQALASAYSAEELYLDVLGPALRRIGNEWAAGRVSVAEEHRASALMQRLIGRLGPLLTRRGRSRGTIVLGAPESDFHSLASALVADVLRGRGFAVVDLGANTPPASFAEALTTADRLVGTGIVVSAPVSDAEIAGAITAT
jgi:excisionase family DNA binding protein